MVDREARTRQHLAEQLERRLAAHAVFRDRLASKSRELRVRHCRVERHRIEAEARLGVREDRLGQTLGLDRVAMHGAESTEAGVIQTQQHSQPDGDVGPFLGSTVATDKVMARIDSYQRSLARVV